MSLLTEFFSQIYWLFKESAIYMIFGILVAGFLRYAISEKRFIASFGGDTFKSTALASIFGIPLPLCSCSVLPMMISLRSRGASKGATTAFLISTPETGVDSISITYALLDPIFTVARPIAALISALATGSIVNLVVRRGWDTDGGKDPAAEEGAGEACDVAPQEEPDVSLTRRALRYGFGTLMDDLTPLLVLAFLGSGLIAVLVPDSFFDNPVTQGWSGMFIMLLVGIPFYVCASSSTPIVAVLLLKGLSPGAALVFLLAGPATNLGTILAVWRYLGRRVMMVYLGSIAVLTLLMGGIIESIYRDAGIPVTAIVGKSAELVPESLKVAGFVLLLALMIVSAARTKLLKRWGESLRRLAKPLRIDPLGQRAKAAYMAVLLLLYGSTCFSVLDVGEEGWLLTFGRVERGPDGSVVTLDEPGLYLHYPFPFQDLFTGRPDEVRSLEFGFRRDIATAEADPFGYGLPMDQDLDAEAQVMDGEESLVSIKSGVQYRLKNAFAYYFGFEDPESAIRGYAAAAVRCVCVRRSTQDILVGHRRELEEASRAILQADLDVIGCGVEILRVSFIDVHAPADVHYAFRDVASAAEDKHKEQLKGMSEYLRTLAEARGSAYRIEQEAESVRHRIENEANGRSVAFKNRAEAYRASRDLTRLRMQLNTLETVLATVRAVIPLAEGIDVELWLRGKERDEPPFLEGGESMEEPEAPARGGGAPGSPPGRTAPGPDPLGGFRK